MSLPSKENKGFGVALVAPLTMMVLSALLCAGTALDPSLHSAKSTLPST